MPKTLKRVGVIYIYTDMFTLRTIDAEGIETNQSLGSTYSVVGRASSHENFRDTFKKVFKKSHYADSDPKSDEDMKNCHGFVMSLDLPIPLFNMNRYYIMASDGKTFDNLSN